MFSNERPPIVVVVVVSNGQNGQGENDKIGKQSNWEM